MENPELINTIRSLPEFFKKYLDGNTKMEDSSVLSCVKKISKGQELWALFCALVNYQIKVKKFLIPQLNSLIKVIEANFKGDFDQFIKAQRNKQEEVFLNLKWFYINQAGKKVNRIGWFHRFEQIKNLLCILNKFKNLKKKYSSLKLMTEKIYKQSNNFENFLRDFIKHFYDLELCGSCNACVDNDTKKEISIKQFKKNKIIPSSPCFKKYIIFFRWMVEKPPDLELWTFISGSYLLIPLDVHVQRIMARIGILKKEKNCKWRDVIKVTNFLLLVDPVSPIYYDLALSRLGILEICHREKEKSKCKLCPLKRFCNIN